MPKSAGFVGATTVFFLCVKYRRRDNGAGSPGSERYEKVMMTWLLLVIACAAADGLAPVAYIGSANSARGTNMLSGLRERTRI